MTILPQEILNAQIKLRDDTILHEKQVEELEIKRKEKEYIDCKNEVIKLFSFSHPELSININKEANLKEDLITIYSINFTSGCILRVWINTIDVVTECDEDGYPKYYKESYEVNTSLLSKLTAKSLKCDYDIEVKSFMTEIMAHLVKYIKPAVK